MPIDHKSIEGRIRYTSNKPDRKGQERGREHFLITKHTDGRRTMRAHCEIDDAPSVMRDVTLSLDADWKPLDSFVRLTVGDRFMGSGWFRFAPNMVECETFTEKEGRVSQTMAVDQPVRAMGCHPIAGDGWYLPLYDLSKGPGKQNFKNVMLSSPDHRGATGPMLFKIGIGIQYIGKERVTVEAGTFDALKFAFVDTAGELPEEHPPYNVWVTDDGDYIVLKAQVDGYMMTYYELTELRRF